MQLPPECVVTVVAFAQVDAGGALHVTPVQRLTHAPVSQTGLADPQLPHAAPAAPHSAFVCEATATQVLPSQQPAQLPELQLGETATHAPLLHSCPEGQVAVVVV